MPLTDQEIEEWRKRILTLEEEKETLKKKLEGSASKSEITGQLADVTKQINELRDELKTHKPAQVTPTKNRDIFDWIFDLEDK